MHLKNIFLTIVILSATACSHSMDPHNTEQQRARYNELLEQQKSKAESCQLTVDLDKSVHDLRINDDDTIAFIKEFAALKLKFEYFSPLKSDQAIQLRFEEQTTLPTLPDEASWQEMKKLGVNKKKITLYVVPKPVSLKTYTEERCTTDKTKNETVFTINFNGSIFTLAINKNKTFADLKNACKSELESQYGTFVNSNQDLCFSLPQNVTPRDTDILGNFDLNLYSNVRLCIMNKNAKNKQAQTE
jgi:hypothetical protein